MRTFTGPLRWLVRILSAGAILYAVFELLHVYAFFDIVFYNIAFRALFTGMILALVFLAVPPTKKAAKDTLPWYDALLALIAFGGGGLYPFLFYEEIALRAAYATYYEIILGIIVILLVIEATRRTTGWVLVFILIAFVLYTPYCNYFPGMLRGYGYSLPRAIGHLFLFEDGMFGLVIGVISSIVVAFLLFAQLLFIGGAGKFVTDLSFSLFGGYSGGPAKGAVLASAGFGMISGSPVGDVVTTGSFTIPMMIKTGYKRYYAGAVEAVSSSGAALMPPVMGTVAFIMAEFLDVHYAVVCLAALWPATLYYIAIFLQVHYQARKLKLVGLPRHERPPLKQTLAQGWLFFIPLFALLYFLIIARYDAEKAAFYAIGVAIIVGIFKKETRLGPRRLFEGLEKTGMRMIHIVPVCAAAGLIIGSVGLTGLGIHMSSILITISKGNVVILLILAAVASVIMSMGMPWTGCYIILAILIAPTLVTMGIEPIAAHLFLLYIGLIAFITPPICIAIYAVCTISESGVWSTGFQAVRLGIISYLVPFIFVFEPSLILKGSALKILSTMATSLAGVFALASGLEGYFVKRANWLQRFLWLSGGICLIIPGVTTDIPGIILLAGGLVYHGVAARRVCGGGREG